MKIQLFATTFHEPVGFAAVDLLLEVLALVGDILASAEAEVELDVPLVVEIGLQRDDGEALGLDGSLEAVEFTAAESTHFLQTPLKDLHLKQGLLVAAIVHDSEVVIPDGNSKIHAGDRVIIVARKLFLQDLNDILER